MPADKRIKLIRKIMRQYDAGAEYPLVGVDEFFDGNGDLGSIAPNLGDLHPGLETFWNVLRSIREREDVADVLVAIHECPEPDDDADADMWPYAENVHVITRASAADVEAWVGELKCDGVGDGWPYGEPEKPPKVPKDESGQQVVVRPHVPAAAARGNRHRFGARFSDSCCFGGRSGLGF